MAESSSTLPVSCRQVSMIHPHTIPPAPSVAAVRAHLEAPRTAKQPLAGRTPRWAVTSSPKHGDLLRPLMFYMGG